MEIGPTKFTKLYLRDPQRIELSLPPRLLWSLCVPIARDPNSPDWWINPILADLGAAVDAAFDGVPRDHANKLIRGRLERARELVLGEFERRQDQQITTPLYAVHLLVQDLLATYAWTFEDGGPFDRAYRSLMSHLFDQDDPACAANAAAIDAAERSAIKNARRMRERLAAAGYYRTPCPAATDSHGAAA